MAYTYFNSYKIYYDSLINSTDITSKAASLAEKCNFYSFKINSTYFNKISESKWSELGAPVVKTNIIISLKSSIEKVKEAIENNLVQACNLSINSLLPKVIDVEKEDRHLQRLRHSLSNAESTLNSLYSARNSISYYSIDKEGNKTINDKYTKITASINREIGIINGIRTNINTLIKTLTTLCLEANGFIVQISSLDGSSISLPNYSGLEESDKYELIPLENSSFDTDLNISGLYNVNDENQRLVYEALLSNGYISQYNSTNGFRYTKDGTLKRTVATPEIYAYVITDSSGQKQVKIVETNENGNSSVNFAILKGSTVSLYTILPFTSGRPFALARSVTDVNDSSTVKGKTLVNSSGIKASNSNTWISLVDFKDNDNNKLEFSSNGTPTWLKTTVDSTGTETTQSIVIDSNTSKEDIIAFEEATTVKVPLLEIQLTGVKSGQSSQLSNTTQCSMTYNFAENNSTPVIRAASEKILSTTGAGGLGGGGIKMMSNFKVKVVDSIEKVPDDYVLLE
ncbi:MAG: hypothetical protein PHD02_02560 [Bacilli bacterium]|nr:hypothetical protein [Bacilli bacterium]